MHVKKYVANYLDVENTNAKKSATWDCVHHALSRKNTSATAASIHAKPHVAVIVAFLAATILAISNATKSATGK